MQVSSFYVSRFSLRFGLTRRLKASLYTWQACTMVHYLITLAMGNVIKYFLTLDRYTRRYSYMLPAEHEQYNSVNLLYKLLWDVSNMKFNRSRAGKKHKLLTGFISSICRPRGFMRCGRGTFAAKPQSLHDDWPRLKPACAGASRYQSQPSPHLQPVHHLSHSHWTCQTSISFLHVQVPLELCDWYARKSCGSCLVRLG